MKHLFYKLPLSFITTLLLILALSAAFASLVEGKSAPTINHKRPPFNGSIFGKRSAAGDPSSSANWLLRANPVEVEPETPLENLAGLLQRNEALIKAALNQCYSRAPISNQVFSAEGTLLPRDELCAQIFGAYGIGSGSSKRRNVDVVQA